MKKTLIIITAITLLLSACNADATSGLYRTATQAREAIDIQYKQILGIDSSGTLYFRTVRGIFSLESGKSASNAKLIVASKEGNIVGEAALTTDGKILYKTNKSNVTIYEYISGGAPTEHIPADSTIKLTRLMPNGMTVARREANSGDFWVIDIDEFSNDPIIDVNVPPLGTGYDYYGLFTPSNYKDPSINEEFLLSFVGSGEYKNFYFDGTNLHDLTGLTEAIANFAVDGDKLYVLTVSGKLYYYASSPYTTAPTLLAESPLDFERDGMFYPIEDTVNNKVHFITNPRYSDSMTVFTVVKANPEKDTTKSYNIKLGYAATLKDTTIVSTLALDDDSFLAATEKHGMYSVEVDPENVNKNDSSNVVNISKAEEYEF